MTEKTLAYFTWSNNRESLSWSRINRFILSLDWEALFPDFSQRRLPRILSNHFPLLLDCGDVIRSSWYFKFDNVVKLKVFLKKSEKVVDVLLFLGLPKFYFE